MTDERRVVTVVENRHVVRPIMVGGGGGTVLDSGSSTGIVVRTGLAQYLTRSIAVAATLAITNADGVSGNPTISIAPTYPGQTSIDTVGTVTTGVWNAGNVTAPTITASTAFVGSIGGGTVTPAGMTAGSVYFAGTGGVIAQDNANFFWDDTNNRLGIGTAAPSHPLQVVRNQDAATYVSVVNTSAGASASANFQMDNGARQAYFGIWGSAATTYGPIAANDFWIYAYSTSNVVLVADGNASIKFATGTGLPAVERMRVSPGGNLLIGTTTDNAADRLQIVTGGSGAGAFIQDATAARLWLRSSATDGYLLQHVVSNDRFRIYRQGTPQVEAFTVLSSGRILIGATDDTTSLLQVAGSGKFSLSQNGETSVSVLNANAGVGAYATVYVGESASAGHYGFIQHLGANYTPSGIFAGHTTYIGGADTGGMYIGATNGSAHTRLIAGGSERMRIVSGGNVLIGTTTDDGANKLQVSGTALVAAPAGAHSVLSVHGATGGYKGYVHAQASNGTVAASFGADTVGGFFYMETAHPFSVHSAGLLVSHQSTTTPFIAFNSGWGGTPDAYIKRYAAKQISITGDGTGATTNAGFIIGYGNSSGYGALTSSAVTPNYSVSTANFALSSDGATTYLNSGPSAPLYITVAAVPKLQIQGGSVTAFVPFVVTAGTATTDVQALSITQTWNNAAVAFSAFKLDVTNTASAAASRLVDVQYGAARQLVVSPTASATSYVSITGGLSDTTGAGPSIVANTTGTYTALNLYDTGGGGVFMYSSGNKVLRVYNTAAPAGTNNVFITNGSGTYNASIGIEGDTTAGFRIHANGGNVEILSAPSKWVMVCAPSGTPVNYVTVTSANTGSGPSIAASGTDTNINLTLTPKGSGIVSTAARVTSVGLTSSASVILTGTGGASLITTADVSGLYIETTANGGIYFQSDNTMLFRRAVGGSYAPQFAITPTASAVNYITVAGGATGNGVTLSAAGSDANISIVLTPKASGVVEQRNSTNAQVFRIYNTYTDASNYERGQLAWSGNILYLTASAAGTGTARQLIVGTDGAAAFYLRSNGINAWQLTSTNHFAPVTDDSYTVGISSLRPQTAYISRSIVLQGPTGYVNGLTLSSAATGVAPSITAAGSDTNISIYVTPKGIGSLVVPNASIYVSSSSGVATYAIQAYGADNGNLIASINSNAGQRVGMQANAAANYAWADGNSAWNFDNYYATTPYIRFRTTSSTYEQLRISHTASAVNYVNVTGGATGNGVTISALGSDSNISLNLTPKGTGNIVFNGPLYTSSGSTFFKMQHTGAGTAGMMFRSVAGSTTYFFNSLNRDPTTGTFDDTAKTSTVIIHAVLSGSSYISFYAGGINNTIAEEQLRVSSTASAVNYVNVTGAATGGGPVVSALGSDTDIDLVLTPKGTGVLKFGTHTAIGAETVTGYITIKDSGGTTRKLAVVS